MAHTAQNPVGGDEHKVSVENFINGSARRGKDSEDTKGRLCEAYYYAGEERLWKGDKEGAAEFFQKSVDSGATGLHEYGLAKAMLRKLKGAR
ncbi:MAG: hypothetical protein OEV59_08725 [Deltaproteobacteria bacterium]|nr:hypothetical protein [Deltaproteobacteria bacterium]